MNRISTSSVLFSSSVLTTNNWSGASNAAGALNSEYTYDPNGNILTLKRNGTSLNPNMDDLTYNYDLDYNNQLLYVSDAITSVYNDDIDNQFPENYAYDEIGNLIKDNSAQITAINWTVYGKISDIQFARPKPNLYFKYDAAGNRVSKKSVDSRGNFVITFYVRDAQGNVLTTYDYRTHHPIKISEQMIYGSSRIGLNDKFSQLISWTEPPFDQPSRTMGLKSYELTDHLGNVLTTISDRKKRLAGTTPAFEAVIETAQDYYPFGSLMPGRKYNAGEYRFGFQGQESENDITGVHGGHSFFKYRISDSRLGRFYSLDPLANEYPFYSPYAFSGNRVIDMVEQEGLQPIPSIASEQEMLSRSKLSTTDRSNLEQQQGKQALMGMSIVGGFAGLSYAVASSAVVGISVGVPTYGMTVAFTMVDLSPDGVFDEEKVKIAPRTPLGALCAPIIQAGWGKETAEKAVPFFDMTQSAISISGITDIFIASGVSSSLIQSAIKMNEELTPAEMALPDVKQNNTGSSNSQEKEIKSSVISEYFSNLY